MEAFITHRRAVPGKMIRNRTKNMQPQKKETTLKSTNSALQSVPGWIPAAALAIILSLGTAVAYAQAAPANPVQQKPAAAPSAPAAQAPYLAPPTVPIVNAVPADPLPPADPKNFTVASPTVETVNAFLNQVWGYDSNRVWRVMAISQTIAPKVTKVIVYLTTKSPDAKLQVAIFYVTPDGNYVIEGASLVYFSATPYAATRDLLKARATGAARGGASKDLMLVEFADLQCPYCKVVQTTMDQIVKDFPAARVVFQQFPLVEIHSSAFKAAAYGVCAQKQSDDAFFKYAAGVFDTQQALAPTTEDTLLRAAAQRAGLDGLAIVTCANMQATKDIVNADIKLAVDAGIEHTPTLVVNGRAIPLDLPYDLIKQIIVFQAKLDGVATGASADILAPTPPAPPALNTLPK
jgi:protein-disulfide isomerase